MRFLVAWCTLVGRGGLRYSTCRHRRLVRSVQAHMDGLTAGQLDRLLAAQRSLGPAATRGDSVWLASWQAQVERRRGGLASAAARLRAALCRSRSRLAGGAAHAAHVADAAAVAAAQRL